MPIALIKILEGRSPEKKRRLIESVSLAMAESLEMPIDGVRVLIEEVPPDCWGRGGKTVADRVVDGSAALPKA
ncbi:2-hydroxymuconate tautomerase family protein [Paraburkholderia sp. RP-4-7]|jgi:4-oxalocrotonate tautomerase|uniref:Tautomerase n=1 Tax=Paraburkholderia polaris TaxID=2728848 RepID=A0A848I8S1_9BURK|nr:2-hydroxymuconate tautomerase family protein [Paraburkholderia polaris]NML97819.1 2-hydroxymuconate tautomerase family protein [Paraburkholderia polaris]